MVCAMSCEAALSEQTDWPSAINLNKKDRTLELVWNGAHVTLSHKVLRRSCRCSVCESTRRKLNDVIPVAADITLLDIEVLGSTGVRLYFSDQHDRGIYPWSYLRQIAFGAVDAGFTECLMKGWRDE
ncbi:MAG: hypothetical protein JWQ10_2529 [Herbaspirillum sp.]|jgi:DUF971 family protein|nr:hypothetical protein [Herbaspirillum sp.]